MLNHHEPKEYLLATGQSHSVREFIELACRHVGLTDLEWKGSGLTKSYWLMGCLIVVVDPSFYRPADTLTGDASLAIEKLGWNP